MNIFQAKLKANLKSKQENLFEPLTEEELLAELEEARKQIENGQYRNADDVVRDIQKKYGL